MIKALILFSVLVILNTYVAYAKEVSLVVKAPYRTSSEDTLYLTNSLACKWRPDCQKLERLGDRLYRGKVEMKASSLLLKVTRGSWDTEAAGANGDAWENTSIDASKSEVVLNLENWKDLGNLTTQMKRVKKIEGFYFPNLGYRKNLYIYLPREYKEDVNKRYPIIYAHDGNNLFFAEDSTFGTTWDLAHTLDDLIEKGEIPPVVVVGISSDNTLRYDEYDFSRTGKKYSKDIIEVVMPYIRENYRVSEKSSDTFLLGSSMGALISFEMLTSYPKTFSKAAGLSFPAFIHNRAVFRYLKDSLKPFDKKIFFYFDHGDFGYDKKYAPSAKEFHNLLRNDSYLDQEQLVYKVFAYGDHNERDWARRVYIPLKMFFSAL